MIDSGIDDKEVGGMFAGVFAISTTLRLETDKLYMYSNG
jgi:hypothetical protein